MIREIVGRVFAAFHRLDLVGALERPIDPRYDFGHRAHGIEALIGIHLPGIVGVGRDLPPREIDCLQAGLDLLHGLVAGERTQGRDEGFVVEEIPELAGAAIGQGVRNANRTRETTDLVLAVVALDAAPPGMGWVHDIVSHGFDPWSVITLFQ
jgi:hypothetical protein